MLGAAGSSRVVPESSKGELSDGKGVDRRWLIFGIVLCALALTALVGLQYLMPRRIDSAWGLNYAGVRHFQRQLLSFDTPQLTSRAFAIWFRSLTALAWVGYGLAVTAGLRGARVRPAIILAVSIPLSIVLAVIWPASLSSDVYAYLAHGRMDAMYGANPYTELPDVLRRHGDPVADFLHWNLPCVYGPIWTMLPVIIVRIFHTWGLWWQVIAMKLVQAAALAGLALAGRAIAERTAAHRGDLTLLALALNPLFLIEGPGNGHNDVLMMALFLCAALFFIKSRYVVGSSVVGLSAGIKFVTLAALPWMFIQYMRGRRMREVGAASLGGLLLAIGVLAVGYIRFWEGISTLTGAYARWAWDRKPSAETDESLIAGYWPLVLLLVIFVLLTVWVWQRKKTGITWPAAWAILAVSFVLLVMPMWPPWFFIWPLAASLTQWDKLHTRLSLVSSAAAFTLTLLYVYPG